jgi:hypothetical protein
MMVYVPGAIRSTGNLNAAWFGSRLHGFRWLSEKRRSHGLFVLAHVALFYLNKSFTSSLSMSMLYTDQVATVVNDPHL